MYRHVFAGAVAAFFVVTNAPIVWANSGAANIVLARSERGAVLPIETVLAQVRQSVQGEVVGVDLEREKGIWVYEVKVISPDGRLIEIYVDAHAGNVLSQHSRRKGFRD